jgi:ArsR family transcriptional regulator
MTSNGLDASVQLETVVDGLVARTGGAIPRHQLRDIVMECYQELSAEATVTGFLPILTGRLALARLEEFDGADPAAADDDRPTILVLDEHNAARSQTAAALLRFYAPGRFLVTSAGLHPENIVNPMVVDLLGDVATGLTEEPKAVTEEMLATAAHVIGIGEVPADLPGLKVALVRWDISDPGANDRAGAEALLGQIDEHVREFLLTVDPDHHLHDPLLADPVSAETP